MTDTQDAVVTREDAAPRTRDWVWALVVVVGGMLLITATLVWILVGTSSCGTRPAAGDENAGAQACRSLLDSRRVARAETGTLALTYPPPSRVSARPYRRST